MIKILLPRTERRRWLLLGLAAFALRASLSLATEIIPLFPSYYYHDAKLAEVVAAKGWEASAGYPPARRAHIALITAVYAIVPHPLAAKLINALLGAASIVFFGLFLRSLFSPAVALASAGLVTAWPSHVFYTSQNFKESTVFFLFFGALALASARRPAALAAAALGLAAAASMRGALAAGMAGAAALSGLAILRDRRLAPLTAAAALAAAVGAVAATDALPRLDAYRQFRLASDREYAAKFSGPTLSPSRTIGTQIEPNSRVGDLTGFLFHLPRAGFAVLFQPLPGLYPTDGRLGRRLAAAENCVLILLCVAAMAGTLRGVFAPERAALWGFFLAMVVGSALLEFDLGSASRHKLLYLPMLFPFATEELLRRSRT